ncbi:4-carboxy-4-hydroxy-2-oxoadipate aldolase/oxaloacetate decarboxylase [Xylophilus sp. GOD-11R]|uniref:4-carboxy-4-hydroxy-2-oxoadipate aldolase/oxaloacetate decarboxylase n=1 Tax=Xylophilus sp. GOD-11R TaxID=3089814 RepID=UPI00298BC93E|nr:4-carboxy-4-hydroxy-2-oxoadipate aldolase/oxaloacetate decarboxylase [Xylophilus sp. GOD-11R]WPB57706.1 4-carboxy-4-hydroxy-2-oxoadipate aldolase/oxaloacetate decarboxylase [Xylophilus sp. GOD-11R]
MRQDISSEKLTTLRQLGAATVYEAQGAKGALDSGMKPIDPTVRLAGPAFTVDCRPADNLMLHYAVMKARPGDVLVVDAKAFMEAGPWGDVLTIQAMKVGIAGLVINGCVRDANLIIELGFPVFCRGLSIKGTGKNQPGRVQVPVCIGDVQIHPGDIVVGDRDGLAVVPAGEVDAAIASAVQREEKEAGQREAIGRGVMTAELLGLTDTLRRLGLD